MTKSSKEWAAILGVQDTVNKENCGLSEFRNLPLDGVHFFSSRYGDVYALKKESGRYLFVGAGWIRAGFGELGTEDQNEISFIDPAGGPFISKGMKLSEIAWGAPRIPVRGFEVEGENFYIVV